MKKVYRNLIIACCVFAGLVVVSNSARAQNNSKSQFGAVFGFSVPDADNTNPRQIYGVKGAAFLTPTFSLGGYYFLSQRDEGTGGRQFEYSLHGVEGAYHVTTGTGDTFFAFRVGLTKVHTEPSASEKVIFSPYHYGVAAGYDYYIMPWVSLGFEGHYLHIQKADTTKNAVLYEEESFSTIGFLIALQFSL